MNWKNFFTCGLIGWTMEILFTAAGSLLRGDFHLVGQTSLWMFPIYGMAALVVPLYSVISDWPILCRGVLYGIAIMCGEFITGTILSYFGVCPWNYADATYNIRGIVRLDYYPFWIAAGLVFERLLVGKAPPVPEPHP